MGDHVSILLPQSRVALFASSGELSALAGKLAQDWRFARVGFDIVTGDIDAAIAAYGHQASPELVIVETTDISAAFIERLGTLAGVCAQGTDAVVIGPKNDVHVYRSLVGMGVRDYLVLPVSEDDLVDVIAKVLLDKKGVADSRLSVVIGGKGGVGGTMLAQSLALIAAEDLGQKTLLTDAAGTAGTLGLAFGVDAGVGYGEALRLAASGSDDDVKRMLQKPRDNLSLLVSSGENMLVDHGDTAAVERLLARLMRVYPLTVFDATAAAHAVQRHVLTLAGHITLVTTPSLPVLRNTRVLLAEIRALRGGSADVDLVLNMQGLAGADDVPVRDIQAALDLAPGVTVSYQPKIFAQAEATQQPVVATKAGADLRQSLLPLAQRLAGAGAIRADAAQGDKSRSLLRKLIGK